jgi:hypothetical protein
VAPAGCPGGEEVSVGENEETGRVNWDEVERLVKPSPNYQTLIKRLQEAYTYEFVRQYYTHTMAEAERYATDLLGCNPKRRHGDWLGRLRRVFRQFEEMGVKDYPDLIDRIETRSGLEDFFGKSGLTLAEIIGVLRYLHNWVLPSKMYLRALIDKGDQRALAHVTALREHGFRFTLDILELRRTRQGRKELCYQMGAPYGFVYEMVNRADFTRMPFASGATVRHYFHGGCTTLQALANADLSTLTEEITAHFNAIGKNLKRAMELDSGIAIARVVPSVVEH